MTDEADERASARVGEVLNDKWTLERLIGIGGMAAVYAGLHRNGARAAIKVLHPALARRAEVKRRFLREGYAANRVGHSGVVKVLDDDEIVGGPDDGGAFLVMELLEGQSVEDRLERGPPIGERELMPIARAVLDVLEAAHAAGVIHRDLKPENLFLARDPEKPSAPPRIKILDFGLARIAEGGSKTMAGIAIGTPSYMPPEQAAGRIHEVDARSDLFALGASCFRILANRTVHPADGAMAICARMAREPAPKLRSVAPHVSEKTATVIDRALEFRRDDRWPNAAAMRAAVDDALAELGGDVVEVESGMIEVIDPGAPKGRSQEARSSEVEEEEVPPPPPPTRRSSWWVWLLVLAGLGVGVKVALDRGLLSLDKPTGEHAEASVPLVQPEASTVDAAIAEAGQPIADAVADVTPEAAVVDAEVEEDASTTAETADADALSEPDASPSHANVTDAGASAPHHRRDGGVRHPPGHPTRHHH